MSKMRMPEMDAVRFQESDVIVASINTLYIKSFNNDVHNDGYIEYDNAKYGNGGDHILNDLYDVLGDRARAKIDYTVGGGTNAETLTDAIEVETSDMPFNIKVDDGYYSWIGGMWKKQ